MSLRSMRLRLTLAFLLILAPFLFISSHLVAGVHRSQRVDEVNRLSKILMEKSARALLTVDAREELDRIFSADEVKDNRIGALVVNGLATPGQDPVVWRSPNDAPAWPRPLHDDAPDITVGSNHMIFNLPELRRHDDRDLHALIMLNVVALAAFAIAAWVLVGRTLHPIRALAHQAAAASVGDAETRLISPSPDIEMSELVATLNGLLGRIDEASAEKGRFYAAASHELRTPLQALLGHLEVALGQPRTEEEYQSTLREAQIQTQRLVSLVEGILLLHQLQISGRPDRESVCLTSVVEDQLGMLMPLVEARGLLLSADLEEGIQVASIPTHAQVLVRNLLENAAKYGREGGALSVRLTKGRLRIENEVPEQSVPDVERLFEPFYRQDASRSARSGGNGLGLAICRAVAKANEWEIELRAEKGWIFTQVDF